MAFPPPHQPPFGIILGDPFIRVGYNPYGQPHMQQIAYQPTASQALVLSNNAGVFPSFPFLTAPMMPMGPPEKNTTLFIGSIAPGIMDDFMERLLRTCGTLTRWKRVYDHEGNPKSFGFCEYLEAPHVLTALRVLGGLPVGAVAPLPNEPSRAIELVGQDGRARRLLVNGDKKTQAYLRYFIQTRPDITVDVLMQKDEKVKEACWQVLSTMPFTKRAEGDMEESVEPVVVEQEVPPPQKPRPRSPVRRHREASPNHNREPGELYDPMADPELDEINRRAKYDQEKVDAYEERLKRWEVKERSRLQIIERDEQLDSERKARRERDRQEWSTKLMAWNDDEEEELARDDYYADRKAWRIKRQETRFRELEQDKRDLVREQEESKKRRIKRSLSPDHKRLLLAMPQVKPPPVTVPPQPEQEEVDEHAIHRKRKLVTIEFEDEDKKRKRQQELREKIKDLADEIPVDPHKLYAYPIHWEECNDAVLSKLRLFVGKKVFQVLGIPGPEMVNFVMNHLKKRGHAHKLAQELYNALDNEASQLVFKLWRMLIFETEARHRKWIK